MSRKLHKYLTEEKFNLIKQLKKLNVKNIVIAEMIQAAPSSVAFWNKYENWESYCVYKRELAAKYRVPVNHNGNGEVKAENVEDVTIKRADLAKISNYLAFMSEVINGYSR
jgi:hypothetical protein